MSATFFSHTQGQCNVDAFPSVFFSDFLCIAFPPRPCNRTCNISHCALGRVCLCLCESCRYHSAEMCCKFVRPFAQTCCIPPRLLVRVLWLLMFPFASSSVCSACKSTVVWWSSWAGASSLPHGGWERSETLMCVCVWLLPIDPPPKIFHTHRDGVIFASFSYS